MALRRLHPRYLKDAPAVSQLLLEARIAARLMYPSILPCYDLNLTVQGFELVMKRVRGRNGRELLQESETGQDLQRQLGILLQVCDAFAQAHSRLVIHPDWTGATSCATP